MFGALGVTPGLTAVRVTRPFFDHRELWPDLILPELRIAIEYDTIGRYGLEHAEPLAKSVSRRPAGRGPYSDPAPAAKEPT